MMVTTRVSLVAPLALLYVFNTASAEPVVTDRQIEQLQRQIDALNSRVEQLEARWKKGMPLNRALQIEPEPGGWRNAANWDLLAKEMPQEEVQRILGAPEGTRSVRKFEYWKYGDGKARLYMRRLKSWDRPSAAKQ